MTHEPDIRQNKRAGDADREKVIAQLREAFEEGYINAGEFDIRLTAAYAATERKDLFKLLSDLDQYEISVRRKSSVPDTPPHPSPPAIRKRRHYKRSIFAITAILCVLTSIYTYVSAVDSGFPLHSVTMQAQGALVFFGGVIAAAVFTVAAGVTRDDD